jgi:DNA invertase Pin-like site-specific DNA recombinase
MTSCRGLSITRQAEIRRSPRTAYDNCVVLIDDISRLARDVEAHWELRRTILRAGGKLESPSIEFKQDADSRMVENVLAGAAQHQREKNAEQIFNRMRARLMTGYWVFWKPKGYRYEKTRDQGKMLVRDEPVASIIQEALEGYATGRFDTQVEVKRFLESQPDYPKDTPKGEIRNQRITDLLTQPLYAGYVQASNWDIALRKGRHDA